MAIIIFGLDDDIDEYCPNVEYPISSTCQIPGAVGEWEVVSAPIGADAIFDDPTALSTTVVFTAKGSYDLRFCCEDDGDGGNNGDIPPGLNCPLGIIAGQTGVALLTGCEGGLTQWSSNSGDLIVTPTSPGQAVLTVSQTGNGQAIVTASCQINGITTPYTCTVNMIPADQVLVCVNSPPVQVQVLTCDALCDCSDVFTVNINCDESSICSSVLLTFEVEERCEESDEPECDPGVLIPLEDQTDGV